VDNDGHAEVSVIGHANKNGYKLEWVARFAITRSGLEDSRVETLIGGVELGTVGAGLYSASRPGPGR
jgi:hypothetical protein